MTSYYVLEARETSHWAGGTPSEADIIVALNRTSLTGRTPSQVAQWVGQPRITRVHDLFQPYFTDVVAVIRVAAGLDEGLSNARATAANLKQQLDAISTLSDWSDVGIVPFLEAANGPLRSWLSGEMARTQTAGINPPPWSSSENPTGPTTPDTTPPTLWDAATGGRGGPIQQATNLLTTLGWVAAGGIGLYLLWPTLTRSRAQSYRRSTARANPRAPRKTRDVWEVRGNYGYGHGYEAVTAADTRQEALAYLREYRANEPGVPFKIVKTREAL